MFKPVTLAAMFTKRLPCLGFYAASVLAAQATILLTFDELSLEEYGGPMPTDYAGLKWQDFGLIRSKDYPLAGTGAQQGLISPEYVIFTGGDAGLGRSVASFRSVGGAQFTLDSAYLTGFVRDGLQVQVTGYVRGEQTYQGVYTVNSTEPTLIQFNYVAIDRVRFLTSGGTQHPGIGADGPGVVIDNMVISVPEPGTVGLLAVGGLALLLGCERRRRQARREGESR